ncbi:MAG: hypothetical protein FWF15_08000 [Oscillospiraceae bacterium]|nr:hypothetical protein [Oscillospiraceae bacterium]
MKIRILLIVLISLIIISCSGGNSNTTGDTTVSANNESSIETDSSRLYPDIPDLDLEGFEIHYFARDASLHPFGNIDTFAEEQNGDPVNDAVYMRNQILTEKYNFKVKATFTTEGANLNTPAALIKTFILANEDIYHIIYDGLTLLSPLATEKYLVDLNALKYVDYTKPWWDLKSNQDLSIVHKLYFTYGEHMLGSKSGLYCIFFNKKLAEDYDRGDLYQYVRNDNWNWNTFAELAKDINFDTNGNGKIDVEDMFGFVTEQYNAYTAMIGGGIKVALKDENDVPYLSMNTEKGIQGVENMMKVFGDKDITTYPSQVTGVSNVWVEFWDFGFVSNRFLFIEGAMHDVPKLRGMEADFGILPMPKLFPDQDRYYHTNSFANAQMMSIPVTVGDIDKVAFILEAMACESLYTLTPAYYDVQLKTKIARDEESKDMLDVIFASKTFDIGAAYQWGNLAGIYMNMANTRNNNFASAYASAEKGALAAMEKTIELFLGD